MHCLRLQSWHLDTSCGTQLISAENTNYTLRSGWEAYDIRSIIERTPTHLKAIGANGEPIEIHGQYTLIGPYGDKR